VNTRSGWVGRESELLKSWLSWEPDYLELADNRQGQKNIYQNFQSMAKGKLM